MKLTRTQIGLILALAVVVGLAVFAPGKEDPANVIEPIAKAGTRKSEAGAETRPAATAPVLAAAPREPLAEGPVDLFKSSSWYVPPPPPPPPKPVPPPPPPPPTAPPLPFSFIGRYDDGVKAIFMLARGDLVVTAGVGDKIDNAYQVESLQGRTLVINYLPLNQKQTLDVGAPQ